MKRTIPVVLPTRGPSLSWDAWSVCSQSLTLSLPSVGVCHTAFSGRLKAALCLFVLRLQRVTFIITGWKTGVRPSVFVDNRNVLVDNLNFIGDTPSAANRAVEFLQVSTHSSGLVIDWQKTWAWGSNAATQRFQP